jgi:hypothetical protein
MPSPFPGMNPYLEQPDAWADFHHRFVIAIGDALTALVRPNFIVKVGEHVFIHELSAEDRYLVGHADVSIARHDFRSKSDGNTAMLASPLLKTLPGSEMERQLFLEIRDRQSRDLIAVFEVLSPSNKKPGADRQQYIAKRGNILQSDAHLIEIDFLRGWQKMPLQEGSDCDYSILISRAEDRPKVNYWPINLRDSLPRIPIPLTTHFAPVELDIPAIFQGVFERAGYQDYIYENSPVPPLSPKDAAWAASLLAS